MRRAYIYILALVLIGCRGGGNEPYVLDYEYERLSPLMVRFTNLSGNADEYRWDFGDGTWSTGRNATKVFATTGEYNVTLTCTVNGTRYDRSKRIVLSKPAVYIAGYVLYRIPYENRYYKLIFTDDALLPSSWDFQTTYTRMLDNADMPYSVEFYSARNLDIYAHDYIQVAVIRTTNATSSDNDVQCMKQKITQKELLQYQPEYVLETSSGSTAVGVVMVYRY